VLVRRIIFFLPSFLLGTIHRGREDGTARSLPNGPRRRAHLRRLDGRIDPRHLRGRILLIADLEAVRFSSASRLCCCSARLRHQCERFSSSPSSVRGCCVFAARSQSLQSPLEIEVPIQRANYFTIRIEHRQKLDGVGKPRDAGARRLVHSLNDGVAVLPGLRNLNIFDELLRWKARQAAAARHLFTGRRYTLPRCIEVAFPTRVSTSPRLIRKSPSRIPVHGSSTKHARPHSEHRTLAGS